MEKSDVYLKLAGVEDGFLGLLIENESFSGHLTFSKNCIKYKTTKGKGVLKRDCVRNIVIIKRDNKYCITIEKIKPNKIHLGFILKMFFLVKPFDPFFELGCIESRDELDEIIEYFEHSDYDFTYLSN